MFIFDIPIDVIPVNRTHTEVVKFCHQMARSNATHHSLFIDLQYYGRCYQQMLKIQLFMGYLYLLIH